MSKQVEIAGYALHGLLILVALQQHAAAAGLALMASGAFYALWRRAVK